MIEPYECSVIVLQSCFFYIPKRIFIQLNVMIYGRLTHYFLIITFPKESAKASYFASLFVSRSPLREYTQNSRYLLFFSHGQSMCAQKYKEISTHVFLTSIIRPEKTCWYILCAAYKSKKVRDSGNLYGAIGFLVFFISFFLFFFYVRIDITIYGERNYFV